MSRLVFKGARFSKRPGAFFAVRRKAMPYVFMIVIIAATTGIVSEALFNSKRIDFNDVLENGIPADSNKTNNQLQLRGNNYLNARFPKGFPLKKALSELKKAGAPCRIIVDDPGLENTYFCGWDRPDYGPNSSSFAIFWEIYVHYNNDRRTVAFVEAYRLLLKDGY
jgi:hypothetical protein